MQQLKKAVSTKRTIASEVEGGAPTVDELKFEVLAPQYDSFEEFVQAAGGDEAALKFINGAASTGAVNAARASARNSEAAADVAISAARAAAAGYKPSGDTRGPSKKAKLDDFEAIMAAIKAGKAPTMEELQAIAEKY